jgi:hypothetical protein
MTHSLVRQLRFARSEFQRGLEGITDAEARRRFEPMNCISWIVGHLACQENYYWLHFAQEKPLRPGLCELVGYGQPASTPPLADMWEAWHAVTSEADLYLDSLTPADLETHYMYNGKRRAESIGTMLYRNTYHYWFHLGEAFAIRQMLGHTDLPEFVGNMTAATYRPEF